ncbi:Fanconi anemia group F protein [Numida meleagris]|uniref:Fanconi anemia group F protein n=1 Tax=Numida meleagris TaxID=8996 RepID=UPI000B3DB723|nr:Fanconi anemia group F protein [Numida meleagris]
MFGLANRMANLRPCRLGLALGPGARRDLHSNRRRQGRQRGTMEAVLGQVAELPALLAVSRSALVRDWDPPTLDRALEWARYFQHLHDRFRGRPRLRDAVGRRLRQGQRCSPLSFRHLGGCPELLGLALMENRALPPAACCCLLQRLLRGEAGPEPGRLALLARRKAASRLLEGSVLSLGGPGPRVCAEAGLLLCRLREDGREAAGALGWLGPVLEQLPQPRAFAVVAEALLRQGAGGGDGGSVGGGQAGGAETGSVADPLLSWLLEDLHRFSACCLLLPGALLASLAGRYAQLSRRYLDLLAEWGRHLLYDPLQGRWVKGCPEEAKLSWEELRERFGCLCQRSVHLRGQTQAALKLLKAQDGDFQVRGLSVWTDLLLEVEEDLRKKYEVALMCEL